MDRLHKFANNYKSIIQNFSYVSILQIFLLIAPLITYPYLVQVLGRELYGYVITAQVLASYCSLFIDFGSNSVIAKHISINRHDNKELSKIVSSVLYTRLFIWIICLILYVGIIYLIPAYRAHLLLFIYSYGMTLNDVLFPQYFFQGIEKMKYSTLINIFIKAIFIALIFVIVKEESDYIFVPLLYALGYTIGGLIALYMIFGKMQIRLMPPNLKSMLFYIKDCSAILATDLICAIKDKMNYLLLGSFSGVENVVIYDLGAKINELLNKPTSIIRTVLFPYFANNKNTRHFKYAVTITFTTTLILVGITNIFLPQIVRFFIDEDISLWPIRLFTLAPIILSISMMISNNAFIAWGYNKYALYSIIITTIAYIIVIIIMFASGFINELHSFILLALIAFTIELIYRLCALKRVMKDITNKL